MVTNMQKKVIKVLFRKIGSRNNKRIIVFFPDIKVERNNIMSFENGDLKETIYDLYGDCKIEVEEKTS